MLRPDDSKDRQIEKLLAINKALIDRSERSSNLGGSSWSHFQTASALEREVNARTEDLREALSGLAQRNRELAEARETAETAYRTLFNAIEALPEGLALFEDERLVICNRRFQSLFSDLSPYIRPGLGFETYLKLVSESGDLDLSEFGTPGDWLAYRLAQSARPSATFLVSLVGDRWVQVSERQAADDALVLLHTDVTDMVRFERRERAKVLEQQADIARATLDHLIQGIGTFDAGARLVSANRRFRELAALPLHLCRPGVSADSLVEALRAAGTFAGTAQSFHDWAEALRLRRPARAELGRADGVILEASVQRLPDGGTIATLTDVTAERRVTAALKQANDTLEVRVAERTQALTEINHQLKVEVRNRRAADGALRQAKDQAEAANRAKTRVIRAVGHDLLQPLSAAKLYLSALSDTALESTQMELLGRMGRSMAAFEDLMHGLMDISLLESGTAEFSIRPVPLRPLLRGLAEDFGPTARQKGLSLRVVPSGTMVVSDPGYLRRIAQNLVSNAIKYCPSGRVLVGVRHRGATAVLEVWDTGPGIAAEDHERIFQEFQRIGSAGGLPGMGIGLSIVQRACGQLGHDLSLDSAPGRGTVFRVGLPMAEVHGEGAVPPGRPARVETGPRSALAGRTILVIEDDDALRAAMVTVVSAWGVTALNADSVDSAEAMISRQGCPPDVILADYRLNNGETGLDCIDRLRDRFGAGIPAVLITADASRDVISAARRLSVPVLSKPVCLPSLKARMTASLLALEETA